MAIYLRGNVYWARWDEGGKQKRRSLGTKDRREAEALYEDLTAKATSLTVREVLGRWIKYQTPAANPAPSISTRSSASDSRSSGETFVRTRSPPW